MHNCIVGWRPLRASLLMVYVCLVAMQVYNDARRNLIISMIFAASTDFAEVCIFFNDRLLRGVRSSKVNRYAPPLPMSAHDTTAALLTGGVELSLLAVGTSISLLLNESPAPDVQPDTSAPRLSLLQFRPGCLQLPQLPSPRAGRRHHGAQDRPHHATATQVGGIACLRTMLKQLQVAALGLESGPHDSPETPRCSTDMLVRPYP